MFNKVISLSVVALLASSVSTLVIPRATAPAGWHIDLLEDYSVYNARYLALGCPKQHNNEFFDKCCHPLMKDEKLDSRPAECTPPSNAYSSDEPAPESTSDTPAPAKLQATPAPPAEAKIAVSVEASVSGGFATFFYQNGVAGACGKVHSDNDLVAAIDSRRYGNTGVRSGLCGRHVEITNTKNKKKVTVLIADACPTCANSNSIDLSVAAFNAIATPDEGVVPISWKFT